MDGTIAHIRNECLKRLKAVVIHQLAKVLKICAIERQDMVGTRNRQDMVRAQTAKCSGVRD